MGMRSLSKRNIRMAQVLVLKHIILRRFSNARKAVATVGCALRPNKWRYFTVDSDEEELGRSGALPTDVPKGHFAVYVGSERSRFIIPTTYLNHPLFQALLQKAEEEFGFDHQMGLTIPCEEVAFEYITSLLGNEDPVLRNLELDELVDFCTRNPDSDCTRES